MKYDTTLLSRTADGWQIEDWTVTDILYQHQYQHMAFLPCDIRRWQEARIYWDGETAPDFGKVARSMGVL